MWNDSWEESKNFAGLYIEKGILAKDMENRREATGKVEQLALLIEISFT